MWKAIRAGAVFVLLLFIGAGYLGYQSYDDTSTSYTVQHHSKKGERQLLNKEITESTWHEEAVTASAVPREEQAVVATAQGETVEALVARLTLTELMEIYEIIEEGIDDKSKQRIQEKLEARFTQEEIDVLISFGFAEMEHMIQ
ncbi:hypothetical protein [Halalkalibacter hemicellulosilyticus]|uniref:Uncharacterized protein n=1 Tax=Halalkalibacter hemicellulosilyticusJCM 9152 TaxID=1236971 RepID=W4QJ23_9BACI|nr:hypothetical protein [Halalkalibacter hemicellulosilyticus]GAE31334.1 hypothetical protein JCM9152_2793 [Halalkalibacter hemicellulosilyticusJCM 9152]